MNFTEEQFKTFARSSANFHNCSNPSADLNYPSFIALWESDLERKKFPRLVKKFTRMVTNVGSSAAKYTAKVETPRNSRISVSPQVLAFGRKYEKRSYSLSIHYRGDPKFCVNYGSITWVEKNGNHTLGHLTAAVFASPFDSSVLLIVPRSDGRSDTKFLG
ncbi:hypothetical protein MTR67_004127 [Solanum verrucosum]|uniref:Subtilisin-like protease fibronectin type-III domain-containing protein n=1 Tax=Solanum verrucosum TaxID=315347 RepID=A0AAF0PTD1_SOLVR|nr:hypothetical protein MTR67_004118 [Solanum verrucosum]WMV10736.1 hypothetical protein MTR67_004121 [Solanum verrucosum]WMV10739.1 hypothetical protein MTR67_004124 [Solanum verrucosum]WMV10742.1 hypothetical protein MTR67_004127 [Solanum verrucosum]